MISRTVSAALVAGFLAACVATVLQLTWTTPLILQAETFEAHAAAPALVVLAHAGVNTGHGDAHAAEEKGWKPPEGLPRAAFTGLATLVSGVGYAFLLIAVMLALGVEPTQSSALRFALGGFVATSLAPAIGLPPELPGMGGAPLELRQLWWIGTVLATGVALCLVYRSRSAWAVALALALAALPHLVGAPHAAEPSDVPPALAAQFAARSLAIALLFWATLGLGLGWAWTRLSPLPAPARAA
jgi:cobalt transporter subunit CbtA